MGSPGYLFWSAIIRFGVDGEATFWAPGTHASSAPSSISHLPVSLLSRQHAGACTGDIQIDRACHLAYKPNEIKGRHRGRPPLRPRHTNKGGDSYKESFQRLCRSVICLCPAQTEVRTSSGQIAPRPEILGVKTLKQIVSADAQDNGGRSGYGTLQELASAGLVDFVDSRYAVRNGYLFVSCARD
jgi:hypothetical protein